MTTIGDLKDIFAKLVDLLKDLFALIKKFFESDDSTDTTGE